MMVWGSTWLEILTMWNFFDSVCKKTKQKFDFHLNIIVLCIFTLFSMMIKTVFLVSIIAINKTINQELIQCNFKMIRAHFQEKSEFVDSPAGYATWVAWNLSHHNYFILFSFFDFTVIIIPCKCLKIMLWLTVYCRTTQIWMGKNC